MQNKQRIEKTDLYISLREQYYSDYLDTKKEEIARFEQSDAATEYAFDSSDETRRKDEKIASLNIRSGEDIPLSARITAVADVYYAPVSKRGYKEPFPFDKAVGIIREESGTHFDPKAAEAFPHICNDF